MVVRIAQWLEAGILTKGNLGPDYKERAGEQQGQDRKVERAFYHRGLVLGQQGCSEGWRLCVPNAALL